MKAGEFKVSFGRIARTLKYEDSEGTILFPFDVSPNEKTLGRWNLHMPRQGVTENGKTLDCSTEEVRHRVETAFERTRQFASSRGYEVVIET